MSQWIVVASRADAQIFKRRAHGEPELVTRFHNPLGRRQEREELPTQPVFASATSGGRTSPQEIARRFARQIASFLEKARSGQAFDSLILVAEPRLLGAIKRCLSTPLSRMVARVESKDLATIPVGKQKEILHRTL
ncbi:MAG: host attachment protein [Bdellovibrionaceae bacterium]|nr:host attachment protein [Pseudobdellovibrionaceae bacterium]MBX3034888.1 host attachment protein [Pseudobdellovibrionaceae bacterium]